jgi:hypothetical protein
LISFSNIDIGKFLGITHENSSSIGDRFHVCVYNKYLKYTSFQIIINARLGVLENCHFPFELCRILTKASFWKVKFTLMRRWSFVSIVRLIIQSSCTKKLKHKSVPDRIFLAFFSFDATNALPRSPKLQRYCHEHPHFPHLPLPYLPPESCLPTFYRSLSQTAAIVASSAGTSLFQYQCRRKSHAPSAIPRTKPSRRTLLFLTLSWTPITQYLRR